MSYSTQYYFKGQSWCFTSGQTVRVILGQVLSIATCGSRTHTEVTACDYNIISETKVKGLQFK